eukprot:COSAG01_NODE_5473_length_4237_cov_4.988400_4_plen_42_part_01
MSQTMKARPFRAASEKSKKKRQDAYEKEMANRRRKGNSSKSN